jgi:hypothetical protein
MKKLITLHYALVVSALLMLVLSACQKGSSSITDATATKNGSSVTVATTTGDLLIAASGTSTTISAAKDSLYLMNACPAGKRPDTVAANALPAVVTTYLTTNYAGYTFQKAFKILTKAGVADGYVVVINYNGKPVGLRFDAAGVFVKVLEQRERNDHDGPGWHQGGRFDNRNGLHGDTIAVSALPAAIKAYYAANYPTDTLLHAVVTKDTSYIVFSTNKGLFATSFTSKLVFSKRVQLYPRPTRTAVLAANLPAAITTYLTTTYAGYVFDKAFVVKIGTTIDKYVVLIDASGTRYALQFDATGTFVKAVVIK